MPKTMFGLLGEAQAMFICHQGVTAFAAVREVQGAVQCFTT